MNLWGLTVGFWCDGGRSGETGPASHQTGQPVLYCYLLAVPRDGCHTSPDGILAAVRQLRRRPFWIMLTPDGQRHLFGQSPLAKISDPNNVSHIAR